MTGSETLRETATPLADLEGRLGGCNNPPFQISKIKESNTTKQKIEDNPLGNEEERKRCMLV